MLYGLLFIYVLLDYIYTAKCHLICKTRIQDYLKNNKYVTKVTIGKNVKKIGANAFYNCKKLKTITIYTTKLKMSTVGKNAFKGVKKNVVVKVPKAKYSLYKKVLKKRGISKVAKFRKM